MRAVRASIEREAREGGRLAPTPKSNRNVVAEVRTRERLRGLLLSYQPAWLRLGLGVVLADGDGALGDAAELGPTADGIGREALRRIIEERVLSDPEAVQKHKGGRCKTCG